MDLAIRIIRFGGPNVLETSSIQRTQPGAGAVWIEQEAIGVNYLDVSQRSGAVQIPLPSGLGLEAAGRVTVVGPHVTGVAVGERVAYILGPIGSYASGRLYPAERLVRLPANISCDVAASVLFKGITAHYLLHSTYAVVPGTVVLAYGVAGALGQIMVPWAKFLGAFVIGVVSKEVSVGVARKIGCDAVLVWGSCDLPAEVTRLTSGHKADVVYDGIGKLTFATSIDCLRPRGLMVSFGSSSGPPDPITVETLNSKGSLFLTRPSLAAHATDLTEYHLRADAVFTAVTLGIIKPATKDIFKLSDAASAHAALEGGRAHGAVLLKPDN